MIKVSVIVPVYGVEKYVVKCIDSIINQKLKDIEIIVVNDGTKDNSIKLIEENFNDDRIKIYNKKNGGLASARNYGVKKAKGEYLFFIDSDDFVDKKCLYTMYNKAKKTDADIVICDYYKYFEDGKKEHMSIIPFYEKNNKCSITTMPSAWSKLVKRSIFINNKIEFLEKHCFEDNAIMPYLCAICNKFEYVPIPFYYYVQRDGSILNKNKYSKTWEDIFPSLNNLYNKFEENNLIQECKEELEYIYIEYLLHAANLRFIDYKEGLKNIKIISRIMKDKFPDWRKNYYYKKENIKYKIMVNLFYYNQIKLIKLLRSINGKKN